jgi:hypothetical protein
MDASREGLHTRLLAASVHPPLFGHSIARAGGCVRSQSLEVRTAPDVGLPAQGPSRRCCARRGVTDVSRPRSPPLPPSDQRVPIVGLRRTPAHVRVCGAPEFSDGYPGIATAFEFPIVEFPIVREPRGQPVLPRWRSRFRRCRFSSAAMARSRLRISCTKRSTRSITSLSSLSGGRASNGDGPAGSGNGSTAFTRLTTRTTDAT